jgi:hypothetical protein
VFILPNDRPILAQQVQGGADPVLYATNNPSKLQPILFAKRFGWDVRWSSNTWVPELYLLFEMVCNYEIVNGVQNEHKK